MTATTHGEEKHLGPVQYVVVWAALMVLTGVTLAVWKTEMSYAARVVVALSIATVKAALVAVFFMHLWEEKGVARLVLVFSAVWVALLIGLTPASYDGPPNMRLASFPSSRAAASAGPPRASTRRAAIDAAGQADVTAAPAAHCTAARPGRRVMAPHTPPPGRRPSLAAFHGAPEP